MLIPPNINKTSLINPEEIEIKESTKPTEIIIYEGFVNIFVEELEGNLSLLVKNENIFVYGYDFYNFTKIVVNDIKSFIIPKIKTYDPIIFNNHLIFNTINDRTNTGNNIISSLDLESGAFCNLVVSE